MKICERDGCDKPATRRSQGYENLGVYCSTKCYTIARREKERGREDRNGPVPEKPCTCGCGRPTALNKKGTGRLSFFSRRCYMDVQNEKKRERKLRKRLQDGSLVRFTPAVPDYSGMDIDPAIVMTHRPDLDALS